MERTQQEGASPSSAKRRQGLRRCALLRPRLALDSSTSLILTLTRTLTPFPTRTPSQAQALLLPRPPTVLAPGLLFIPTSPTPHPLATPAPRHAPAAPTPTATPPHPPNPTTATPTPRCRDTPPSPRRASRPLRELSRICRASTAPRRRAAWPPRLQ